MDNQTNHNAALVRLASMLLTIASIARWAACLPLPARRALLLLLRPFERRARRLALDLAADLGWLAALPAPHFSCHCDQRSDAIRMARSLEAIAAVIDQLLHSGACRAGVGRRRSLMHCLLNLAVPRRSGWSNAIVADPLPAPDTS